MKMPILIVAIILVATFQNRALADPPILPKSSASGGRPATFGELVERHLSRSRHSESWQPQDTRGGYAASHEASRGGLDREMEELRAFAGRNAAELETAMDNLRQATNRWAEAETTRARDEHARAFAEHRARLQARVSEGAQMGAALLGGLGAGESAGIIDPALSRASDGAVDPRNSEAVSTYDAEVLGARPVDRRAYSSPPPRQAQAMTPPSGIGEVKRRDELSNRDQGREGVAPFASQVTEACTTSTDLRVNAGPLDLSASRENGTGHWSAGLGLNSPFGGASVDTDGQACLNQGGTVGAGVKVDASYGFCRDLENGATSVQTGGSMGVGYGLGPRSLELGASVGKSVSCGATAPRAKSPTKSTNPASGAETHGRTTK